MNITSSRGIEMRSYREYNDRHPPADPPPPAPQDEHGLPANDSFASANQNTHMNSAPWTESIQQINQKGWVGFVLRWVPVVALCVTVMGGVFAYMNHKALDAQRTLNLVKNLQPILADAHKAILSAVKDIRDSLSAVQGNGTGADFDDRP